jgi:hypothetical protein
MRYPTKDDLDTLNMIRDILSLVVEVYSASVDDQDHTIRDGPSSGLNNETGMYWRGLSIEEREAFLEALQSLDLPRLAASIAVQNLSKNSNDQSQSFLELWNAKAWRLLKGRNLLTARVFDCMDVDLRVGNEADQGALKQRSEARPVVHGITRAAARPGDQLCAISGCPVPMMLRAKQHDDREVFRVVGAAVVPEFGDVKHWCAASKKVIELI